MHSITRLPGEGNLAEYSEPGGDAPPYQAQNPDELQTAIAHVIGSVRSCTYELVSWGIDPEQAYRGSVQLQDTVLVYGDPNGWEMVDETTLEIKGTACDFIKTTPEPFLYFSFPCDAFVE